MIVDQDYSTIGDAAMRQWSFPSKMTTTKCVMQCWHVGCTVTNIHGRLWYPIPAT